MASFPLFLPLYCSTQPYFYAAPTSERPFDDRLRALLAFHAFLQREYARIIHHGMLNEAIQAFRTRFQVDEDMCDERIIDSLLWGWVSILRDGAQERGEVAYD